MTRAIAVELAKFRTVRSTWAIVAGALALVGFCVVMTLATNMPHGDEEIRSLLSFAGSAGLMAIVLGAVSATGEYRHRTIVSQRLIAPDAARLLGAKALASALAGAAIGVAGVLVTDAIALPWLAASGVPVSLSFIELVEIGAGGVTYCALCAGLGVGAGALIRSQVAAVTAVLVALLVIDPTVSALLPEIGRFGPTALGLALSGAAHTGHGLGVSAISPVFAAGCLLLYAGVAVTAGMAASARREIA
jgi:ABC-2 type transport system permease protein